MSMIKVITCDGWDFGEPYTQLVKVASVGLTGNDFKALIKRAGYAFADQIRRLDLKPGDVPAHDIIIGASEFYSVNRNGDGFKEATCKKYHDGFVKNAKCYRHHQARDPEKSYGIIKLSYYHPDMHRIELLSIYNGTKEAAERNGGLVADEECEKLASGKDFSVSMSCKVPRDVCLVCGNSARNRDEYCRGIDEGGKCPGGGLFNKIGTVTGDDENPILGCDNPEPYFFDKSLVTRGADRTAFSMALDKAASAAPRGGAALAELLGVKPPAELDLDGENAAIYKLARDLAELESAAIDDWRRLAFSRAVMPSFPPVSPAELRDKLAAAAEAKILLPVDGFVGAVGRRIDIEKIAEAVRANLPGVYSRLVKSGELASLLPTNPYLNVEAPASASRRWAAELSAAYSAARPHAEKRAMLAAVRLGRLPETSSGTIKTAASMSSAAAALAKQYALCQLTLIHMATKNAGDDERRELAASAVAMNRA